MDSEFLFASPPEWTKNAACLNHRSLFDPVYDNGVARTNPEYRQEIQKAKDICNSCPARELCLEDAMEQEKEEKSEDRWGVRGGLTAKERMVKVIGATECARCSAPITSRLENYNAKVLCKKCLSQKFCEREKSYIK